jgi:hypothetical protein
VTARAQSARLDTLTRRFRRAHAARVRVAEQRIEGGQGNEADFQYIYPSRVATLERNLRATFDELTEWFDKPSPIVSMLDEWGCANLLISQSGDQQLAGKARQRLEQLAVLCQTEFSTGRELRVKTWRDANLLLLYLEHSRAAIMPSPNRS